MEDQLVFLEQLVNNLGSDILDKQNNLKHTFLQYQFGRVASAQDRGVHEHLEELIRDCDFQLLECCRLIDLVTQMKGSLNQGQDLSDVDYSRLTKCEALLEEFKDLVGVYKELIQKVADRGPAF